MSDFFRGLSWVDKVTGLMNKDDETFKKLDSFLQELIDWRLHSSRIKTVNVDDNILDILIRLKEDQKSCSIDLSWDTIKALLAVSMFLIVQLIYFND